MADAVRGAGDAGGQSLTLLLVAAGGAAGALARHGLGAWIHGWAGGGFPWATLGVNVVGSFLLGVALPWMESVPLSPEWRTGIAVGLLGAFTTFSTYSWETAALVRNGAWARGAAYALGSLALGLAAVLCGLAVAGWSLSARGGG